MCSFKMFFVLLTIIAALAGCESGSSANGGEGVGGDDACVGCVDDQSGGQDGGNTVKVGAYEVPAGTFTEDQWKHETHEAGEPCDPEVTEPDEDATCNAAHDAVMYCDETTSAWTTLSDWSSPCTANTICVVFHESTYCESINKLCTATEDGLSCTVSLTQKDDHSQFISDCSQEILVTYGYRPNIDELIVDSVCPTEYSDDRPNDCWPPIRCDYDSGGVWYWEMQG